MVTSSPDSFGFEFGPGGILYSVSDKLKYVKSLLFRNGINFTSSFLCLQLHTTRKAQLLANEHLYMNFSGERVKKRLNCNKHTNFVHRVPYKKFSYSKTQVGAPNPKTNLELRSYVNNTKKPGIKYMSASEEVSFPRITAFITKLCNLHKQSVIFYKKYDYYIVVHFVTDEPRYIHLTIYLFGPFIDGSSLFETQDSVKGYFYSLRKTLKKQ